MRLYWKIFITFWLGTFLLTSLVIVLSNTVGVRDREHQPPSAVVLEGLRRALRKGGVEGAKAWISSQRYLRHDDVFIFAQRKLLYPANADKAALEAVAEVKAARADVTRRWHGEYFVMRARAQGQRVRVVIRLSPPWEQHLYRHFWLRFVFVLVASGLLCWLLVSIFTRRIQLLSHTVTRLADGELSARVEQPRPMMSDELDSLTSNVNQMAQRIEKLLASQTQLLSDVSHELRSPLARMQAALAVYQQQKDDSMLGRIEKDIECLDDLIGDLLMLPRLDAASAGEDTIDLHQLIESIVEDQRIEAENKHCTIASQLQADATVLGTQKLLHSAIENILRNAVKYSPSHSQIDVRLGLTNEQWEISVTDQGDGVADDLLDKIFEPFVRSDEARSRHAGGVGLGLAIASRAVAVHGGSVVAKNLSQGFQVKISLPKQ